MSFRANVFLGIRLMGKCLMGKCLSRKTSSGPISFRQMSIWANIFLGKRLMGKCRYGPMSLGQCLWANVVCGQMLYYRLIIVVYSKHVCALPLSKQMKNTWPTIDTMSHFLYDLQLFVHRTYIPRCSSNCAQARRPGPPSCSFAPLTHPASCLTAQGTAAAAARTRSREERTASILSTLASSRYDSVLNIHLC
jgi:hypothetical protein